MKKIRYFLNKQKEEEFLNQMCSQGYEFIEKKKEIIFYFSPCTRNIYQYRIVFPNFAINYNVLVKELNCEIIQKYNSFIYIRNKSSCYLNRDDKISSLENAIEYYKLIALLATINLLCLIIFQLISEKFSLSFIILLVLFFDVSLCKTIQYLLKKIKQIKNTL